MSTCVVIHGTWGQRSKFAFSNSLFCKALRESLNHDTDIVRFQWSGSNSSTERTKASRRLCYQISNIPEQSKPIFIIAHSHGGNIAWEALRNSSCSENVTGLITLGTPFLTAAPRKWISYLTEGIMGRAGLDLLMNGLIFLIMFIVFLSFFVQRLPIIGLIGCILLITILKFSWSSKYNDLVEIWIDLVKKKLDEVLSIQRLEPKIRNILFIHTRSDEALWWLQRVFKLSSIPFAFVSFACWMLGSVAILYAPIILTICLALLFVGMDKSGTVAIFIGAIYSLAVGLMIISIIFSIISIMIMYFFGTGEKSYIWDDALFSMKATNHPEGTSIKSSGYVASLHDVYDGGMQHSKYMRSSKVIEQIAKKINLWDYIYLTPDYQNIK